MMDSPKPAPTVTVAVFDTTVVEFDVVVGVVDVVVVVEPGTRDADAVIVTAPLFVVGTTVGAV